MMGNCIYLQIACHIKNHRNPTELKYEVKSVNNN